MSYSYDYAKEHKNWIDCYYYTGGSDPVAGIEEGIHLKREINGTILYQVRGRNRSDESIRDFETQFGTFHSEDRGEFGGELITPTGKTVQGNYRYVFDLKDKVYAVSTMAHLVTANTAIECFDNASDCRCIYATKDMFSRILAVELGVEESGEEIYEDLCCDALDIKNDEAYAVLCGCLNWPDHSYIWVCRILRIKDGEVETIKEYCGKAPFKVNSVIVEDGMAYIGCDKTLCCFDLSKDDVFEGAVYRTCLSKEDEAELNRVEADRGH